MDYDTLLLKEPEKLPHTNDAFAIHANVVVDIMKEQCFGDGSIVTSHYLYRIKEIFSHLKFLVFLKMNSRKKHYIYH
jgi:hypothetical protein